jgi:DNA-directed RNA polymerase specialized sigma24 family protein
MGLFLTVWAIHRAVHLLPVGARSLLALYYLQDVPILDIAARWNRHPSRVYERLQHASHRLADRLRAEGLLR